MPNVTIEVRTTCPTCGGEVGGIFNLGCPACHDTGTVVDAERSQWLRTVVEWAAQYWHVEVSQTRAGSFLCHVCWGMDDHTTDCQHVLAKAVLA